MVLITPDMAVIKRTLYGGEWYPEKGGVQNGETF
jgi:hypothetical protein